MHNQDTEREFNSSLRQLCKIILEHELWSEASATTWEVLGRKLLDHLYRGADREKIQRILQSEMIVTFGRSPSEEETGMLASAIRNWWNDQNELPGQDQKLKLLFVCTVNRMRSATAHVIYAQDERFEVQSAGTDKGAATVLSLELLQWADGIIVMEKHHRNYIRKKFPEIYETKKIVCLYIPDEYDYMQPELIELLRHKVESVYERRLI